jgi:hypothetical protein
MGLYTITTRANGTVLTADIFNADHQNHVTHTEPMSINSFEATVAQMQIEDDPAPLGVPSLPTSLSGELSRLRFELTQIKTFLNAGVAVPHWYTSIAGVFFASLPPTAARIEQTTPQILPTGTNQTLVWQVTSLNTPSGMARPDGFIAIATGMYLMGVTVQIDGVPTGDFEVSLERDAGALGTLRTTLVTKELSSNTTALSKAITVSGCAHLDTGDLLRANAYQTSATDMVTLVQDRTPAMWIALLGVD